jgi:hypothetical protein
MKKVLQFALYLAIAFRALAADPIQPAGIVYYDRTTKELKDDLKFGAGRTLGGVGTFDFSLGTLTLANGQIAWAKVNKTGSSLADLVTRNATDLTMTSAGLLGRTSGAGAAIELSIAQVKTFLSLDLVNNTSDANKPISTATQTALDLKAPLASPTFTGTPAAPTAVADTNTTQVATTAYVIGQGYLKSSTAASTYQPLDLALTNLAGGSDFVRFSGPTSTVKVFTLPDVSATIITSNDTGSVTNTMLAGSIANNKLANSSITIAGSSTALGASISLDTITGLSTTGIVKRTGASTLAIATSGTDYAPATSGNSILYGNGAGGFSNATLQANFSFSGGLLSLVGGLTAINSITADVATNLSLNGGSSGATFLLGQGSGGGAQLTTKGSGDFTITLGTGKVAINGVTAAGPFAVRTATGYNVHFRDASPSTGVNGSLIDALNDANGATVPLFIRGSYVSIPGGPNLLIGGTTDITSGGGGIKTFGTTQPTSTTTGANQFVAGIATQGPAFFGGTATVNAALNHLALVSTAGTGLASNHLIAFYDSTGTTRQAYIYKEGTSGKFTLGNDIAGKPITFALNGVGDAVTIAGTTGAVSLASTLSAGGATSIANVTSNYSSALLDGFASRDTNTGGKTWVFGAGTGSVNVFGIRNATDGVTILTLANSVAGTSQITTNLAVSGTGGKLSLGSVTGSGSELNWYSDTTNYWRAYMNSADGTWRLRNVSRGITAIEIVDAVAASSYVDFRGLTTSGTSTSAAAILGKSMGLSENLYVGGVLSTAGKTYLGGTADFASIDGGIGDRVAITGSTIEYALGMKQGTSNRGLIGYTNDFSSGSNTGGSWSIAATAAGATLGTSTLGTSAGGTFTVASNTILSVANATDAATGGVGALVVLGGIYSVKKLITASTVTTTAGVAYDFGAASATTITSPNKSLKHTVAGTDYYIPAKLTND